MTELSVIKKTIISILNLYPRGVPQDDLKKSFRELIGNEIPFEDFCYGSLKSFMESEISENVRINETPFEVIYYPVANKRSGHIAHAVRNQVQNARNKPKFNEPISTKPRNHVTFVEDFTEISKPSWTMPRLNPNGQSVFKNMMMKRVLLSQSRQKCLIRRKKKQIQPLPYIKEEKIVQKPEDGKIDKNSKDEEKILQNSKDERIDQNPKDGKIDQNSMTAKKLRFCEIIRKLEEVIRQKKGKSGSKTTANTPKARPVQAPITVSRAKSTHYNTSSEISENSAEFLYNELDNMAQPLCDGSGFYDVSENGSTRSDNSTRSKSSIHSENSQDDLNKLMMKASLTDQVGEKSEDAPNLLNEINVGDVLQVYSTEITSPMKFWVQILQNKYIKQRETLFKQLQEFFEKNCTDKELLVFDPYESESKYFAAYYYGNWHRCVPCGEQMGQSIQVSFVDYGTRDIINISKMRQLPEEFQTIPKLTICCALENIKPIGKTFTSSAEKAFVDLVDEKVMYAKVLYIDADKSMASVELIQKSNKKCINDEMVRLNYAVAKERSMNA